MRSARALAILIMMLHLADCTVQQPSYTVAVDSLASSSANQNRRYLLLPGNEGVTPEDLQFQEYAQYVRRALQVRGFEPATEPEEAEIAIILSYGIGDPQTQQYTYSVPIWGQTGVASSQTYGTATAFGNMATYSGTTTYTPRYGITGYTTQVGSITTYFRYALIAGYDVEVFRKTGRTVQLWRTAVTSSGSSGDRLVFPILISAAVPYLAASTGQQVQLQLRESDDAVKVIKNPQVGEQTRR